MALMASCVMTLAAVSVLPTLARAETNDSGRIGDDYQLLGDAPFGRDAWAKAGLLPKVGAGRAGFDFTRICWNGEEEGQANCTGTLVPNYSETRVAASKTDWACTRDNVTGFVWSLQVRKTARGTDGPSDIAARQREFDNGPPTGYGASDNRCGKKNNWRVPGFNELLSIVDFGISPTIDLEYFPGNGGDDYGPGASMRLVTKDHHHGEPNKLRSISFALGSIDDDDLRFNSSGVPYRPVWSQETDTTPTLLGTLMGENIPVAVAREWAGASGQSLIIQETLTWHTSTNQLNAMAYKGYTDWRLPNIKELSLLGLDGVSSTPPKPDLTEYLGAYKSPLQYYTRSNGRVVGLRDTNPVPTGQVNNPHVHVAVRGGSLYSGSPVTPPATYTVTTTNSPGGKTICSPSGTVPRGTSVTCIPEPDDGFGVRFTSRTGTVIATCGLNNTVYSPVQNQNTFYGPFRPFEEGNSFTIPAVTGDCNVQFKSFVAVPPFVTTEVTPSSGGSVSCSGSGSDGWVRLGDNASCQVTANPGYKLASISGCGGAATDVSSYVTEPITGACTVAAQFVVPVAPGAPSNTQASPTGSGSAVVTWTAPANSGTGITQYTVSALLNGQPTGLSCTATPPATSCEVTGLAEGQTYTFSVEAESLGSVSEPNPEPSNPVTPLTNSKVFSAPSPDASGDVTVSVSGGGDTCSFEKVKLLTGAAAGAPGNLDLPHGVLDFVLSGCDATEVQLSFNYPKALPAGVAYYKEVGGVWTKFAAGVASAAATTAILTLSDGQAGDDDGVVNGRIVDPGGVGVLRAPTATDSIAAVPTLGAWALMLLATLLGLMAQRNRVQSRRA
ncbi:MAG: IPTL-CTERM sorting domain-containing protein [Comamonadaceae bacterium]|nr:IPTL-CTERM sorting domain-containing protein [Comamonadaceae bacterium]